METRKCLSVGLLNDYYGSLLTDYQSRIVSLYYDEDYSLAEIAERLGISRQGVRDVIVRSEQKLKEYEKKLGLVAKITELALDLENLSADISDGEIKGRLNKIINKVKDI
ncbi:MAG: hypothetical protein GX095_06650 [Clostridiales bacterium]|jgi:predicted DNA-binding protein YlxM (UPF0122 family)|nr:hypothetical protein [Clostridiales bacterium]HOB64046.1 sigma factor-like helix-turn-helix DNA-binding protein [Clostridia bacterium]HOK81279.1 sigma factor-like helix-turn-helix DNA-binding protein [Clostridia bacterium]HOL60398.1 sigma factor-like helix-turn-helix DNA-binding protein [Clostridia bacterium]HPO53155.1 sigma factor-like helix-turn-helix DNA-binding protein [Clostridia bacterium]